MRAAFDARGCVYVVTGGASGIGAALARGLATAGAAVVVLDVNRSDELAGVTGIEQAVVDVADRDQVLAVVADVVARHGRIDGLVAGAAVQPRVPVAQTPAETWRRVLDVNLDGVVWACQAVLPAMQRQRSGSIVVFTSGLAHMGRAEAAAYAASKGALISFAKSLAAEVVGDGVRVNIIAPGVIDTPQFHVANPTGGEREHWERTTGIGTSEDVVGPLLFLLSDAATMTGSMLTRDRAYTAPAREGDDA